MLESLRIRDVGVIADAQIEFAPGLTAITGETGAGKTMVVTGLGLLLGERGDSTAVRHGATKALVEGVFSGVSAIEAELAELGAEVEGVGDQAEVLASRQMLAAGRSRASIGGLQVPVGTLNALVGELATIHGQSEQLRLGSPSRQREVLDQAAGPAHLETLSTYREAYERRSALVVERDELVHNAAARARELDLLRFGLAEIEAVSPQPGEDEELAVEASRLQAVDELRLLSATADNALSGASEAAWEQPGAVGLLGQARKAIEALAARDPRATPLAETARLAVEQANDLAAEVSSYAASLEADPLRLEAISERRDAFQKLRRKYGETMDEVLAWAQTAASTAGELEVDDEHIEVLTSQIDSLDEQLAASAAKITQGRSGAGERLAEAVRAELAALAMPYAQLAFALAPLEQLGPWGAESVQLLFAANAGAQLAPLAKVASGGELSRVRLALEVVLAEPGHTFVFDEVDAGVGGAVGIEIGARLARLARTSQVIVVTHLAQVAAPADRHYVIEKSTDGEVTASDVTEVAATARTQEIARMMGGATFPEALTHAAQLLVQSH
ncbi:MAG: DNA repair protein RecN [Propionibacteriaceae bacterium]|jgi:DNA repair protein RecN (Recombination protein N)|nr:DNA repair protein RecN [Propionibacteriaceae bacterium]